ncbi:hypothetical protein BE221DRAFT_62284 [Ostreococcus tauri]|uniref:Uncharacterized protein n=1 Tax=Ostreococcus tauri TaxID=70448 RepID=A0A1Y5I3F2_OSTTA|nr:hypothetical protein BE221DRAFT_62284 [Ostreococcus tauri]
MSTAKYSGIAVAAANRAALARQEADADREQHAHRTVDAKSEALLAHLRSTMTAAALLGGDARGTSASGATTTSATARAATKTSNANPSDARARVERVEEPASSLHRPEEKRRMSKAERKRLKRSRDDATARTSVPAATVDPVDVHDDAHARERTRKKRKKKIKPTARAERST